MPKGFLPPFLAKGKDAKGKVDPKADKKPPAKKPAKKK